MAYLIFNGNELYKIAANDTEKDKLHLNDSYDVQTISDTDFNNVRLNKKIVSYDGTTITYTDETWKFPDEENLKAYVLVSVKSACEDYLNVNESTDPQYSEVKTYFQLIENFDFGSITYSLDKSWEEYCNDNSITFLHPLQIA